MMDVKTALVTGGAKRIGRTLVKRLLQEGYAVAIHYHRSSEEAEALLAEILYEGGKACLIQGDLSRASTWENLFDKAQSQIGEIGLLINNASLFEKDGIGTLTPLSLDRHLEVNLKAPLLLAQKFAQNLSKGKKGMILNLLDASFTKFSPDFLSYRLSKAALQTSISLLAQALAPDIRVNGIALGFVLPSAQQSRRHFEKMCQATPLASKITLEEIAEAMMAFVKMPSITGEILTLDNGQSSLS